MSDHVLERELVQHAAALRRLARALVGADDADDLVQDATLHLLRARPARSAQLGGLFATVLRQLASKLRRSESRRARRERAAARAEAVPGADHDVARHELVAAVLRELLALPASCRDALLQRFFEDRTPSQIAARLRVPTDTVKTRLKRGLAMLRARLDAGGASGREPWRAGLLAAIGPARAAAVAGAAAPATGAILMSLGTKLYLGAGAAAAAAAICWSAAGGAPHVQSPPTGQQEPIATAASRERPAAPEPAPVGRSQAPPAHPAPPPAAALSPEPSADSFLQALNEVWPLDGAVGIARELAALPGPRVVEILQAIYGRIENGDVRRMILGPLVKAHPQFATALLHFGAGDPLAEVRGAALAELSRYALVDFTADPSRYEEWRLAHGAATAGDAMRASALEHVQRLRSLQGADLAAALGLVDHRTVALAETLGVEIGALLGRAGIGEVLDGLLGSRDGVVAQAAWQSVRWCGADESLLQRHATPLLQAPDELPLAVRHAVYEALGRCRGGWVRDTVVASMLATSRTGDGCWYAAARALAAHGDPAVIPTLIGMIEADGTYKSIYGIGYFALGRLTGVPYDEAHDGAWWRRWWNENRHRLPAAARGGTIPALRLR